MVAFDGNIDVAAKRITFCGSKNVVTKKIL